MNAGDVVVGLQIGGLTTFVGGWKAGLAAITQFSRGAANAMADITMDAVTAGDDIQKMAQRISVSTEALSELSLAFELSGTSMGNFEIAMRGATRMIDGAREGMVTASRSLERMGISLEAIKDIAPEEQFMMLAQGLRGIENASERAALAQQAFGRAAGTILPLINSNIEGARELARQMGNVWTQQEANLAADVKDRMTLVDAAMDGLGRTIAVQVMPYLVNFLEGVAVVLPMLTEWVNRTGFVGQSIDWLGQRWSNFWINIRDIGGENARNLVSLLQMRFFVMGQNVEMGFLSVANNIKITMAELKNTVASGLFDAAQAFQDRIDAIAGTTGGSVFLRAMGIDPAQIQESTDLLAQLAVDASDDLNTVNSAAAASTAALQAEHEFLRDGLARTKDTLFTLPLDLAYTIGDASLQLTDMLTGMSKDATTSFKQLLTAYKSSNKSMQTEQKKNVNHMRKIQQGYTDFAVNTFTSILGGASSSFSEILKAALSSLGAMAIKEGVFHILAGQAKVASGVAAAIGHREIVAGNKLLGWGIAAVAIGGAMGGGGDSGTGGGGGGGGEPESGGTIADRSGPGYEVEEDAEQRQQVQVIVQGSMFDSRETWQRISEIARDHADADIRITESALGRA